MSRCDNFIYSGRISVDDLVGEPDIYENSASTISQRHQKRSRQERAGSDRNGNLSMHYSRDFKSFKDYIFFGFKQKTLASYPGFLSRC